MKRSGHIKWGNLKIGIVLTFAIFMMLWASFTGGGTSVFDSKSVFKCYFRNVNGLVSGSPIWMSGVEVGNVKSVKFVNLDKDKQVEVVCKIKTDVWYMMTEGVEVQLGTIGILGDKYVEVFPGPVGGVVIAEGNVVPTRKRPIWGPCSRQGRKP